MSYRLGIDGGGTKTEGVSVDESGATIANLRFEGCNPSIVGAENARRIASEAIRALIAQTNAAGHAGRPSAILLCMAGSRSLWTEFAAGLENVSVAIAVDDSLPVLELATDGGPGLVLHAGTGSFVAARAANASGGSAPFGDVHYAGGLGWRFGDPGSGYDIGRRAVSRGLLELQGWVPESGLGKLLCDHTGRQDANAVSRDFYGDPNPNARIAGLTPHVLRLAEGGDAVAQEIASDSAFDLLEQALRVAERLFPGKPLAEIDAGLSGPILTHASIMPVLQKRAPFVLKAVTQPPIEGVKRLLARLAL
jgi:N-acetylglucosamine kinase-like BadF-type ATPase